MLTRLYEENSAAVNVKAVREAHACRRCGVSATVPLGIPCSACLAELKEEAIREMQAEGDAFADTDFWDAPDTAGDLPEFRSEDDEDIELAHCEDWRDW